MSPDISNFVLPGKASVLFDGQFGSTGKGLAGAWIGEHNLIDWCTTNASANAGHTSIIDGKPVILFHIPSSFLTARENGYCRILVNKGAIIDLDILEREIIENDIPIDQIFVDPNATVITPEDKEREADSRSSATKIASTQKGCGAALARKVMRDGPNLGQYVAKTSRRVPFRLMPVSLNREMAAGMAVMVEVPQGFSLSLNASGFFPHTTSRDCTLQQGLSDAGIHPRLFHKSLACLRTFPIRVGNIEDAQGRQIGFSGRVFPDQYETSWRELGLAEERTTVTKRVRRVFTFSLKQYDSLLDYCMPDIIFLNFCNYMGRHQLNRLVHDIMMVERKKGLSPLHYFGFGPSSDDIREYT